MATQASKGSLGDLPGAFMNLVSAQMRLTSDLFESLTGQPLPSMNDLVKGRQTLMGGGGGCAPRGGVCAIPAPCWMPKSLGACTSHVAACKTACVRFQVTNCDRVKRTITAQVTGGGSDTITVAPTSLELGPQERGTISVCIAIPEGAKANDKLEALVWLRGCHEYYFRWTISVGTLGLDSCHEVEVCDCPDYLHHWYDHFYCVRPCPTAGRIVGGSVASGLATEAVGHG